MSLIRSMIAASVEDFPDPVGPTRTMPFFNVAISARTGGALAQGRDLPAMTRITIANEPRCLKMLTRNRPRSGSE